MRGEGFYYAAPQNRELFAFILALDNELWSARRKAKEPSLAQIRVQFIRDEIEALKNGKTPQLEFLKSFDFSVSHFDCAFELIESHFKDCLEKKYDEIFCAYFKAQIQIIGIENFELAKLSGRVLANAANGNFAENNEISPNIKAIISAMNKQERELLLPIFSFLTLCNSPIRFNDIIIHENRKRLGFQAKMALFGVILFSRL